MRAKEFLKEYAPDGFVQFKLYISDGISHHLVGTFSSIDDAKEELEYIWDADPETKLVIWFIKDLNDNTVWYYDPQELADQPRHSFKKPDNLNEFVPGPGNGTGRWYSDDEMIDIVGEGWYEDMDVAGDVSPEAMIQTAQEWLDDQGYYVLVHDVRVNEDDCDWYIEGNFYNQRFARKDGEQ